MSFIETLGLQAGSALMGGIVGGINDRRQLKQQEKLMGMQLEKNAEMSRIQHDLQYDMWKKTSYVGQREQMEKAGLNPALMYGMGGGGGSTTGAGSASVSAPQAARGTEIMDMLNMRTQQAQIELMEAQAKKAEADANKTAGIDTELGMAQKEVALMEKIIKEFTGKELEDVYTRIKKPYRGIEEKTWEDELTARQAVAETMYEMWVEGKLKDKSVAELEEILINNSKNKAEEKRIYKMLDVLEEQLQGQKLDNVIKKVESEWASGTGFKSGDIGGFITKLLGFLMVGKRK